MSRANWPLLRGRPSVGIDLSLAADGQALARSLLADSGAGSRNSSFELILDEDDCLLCGGIPTSLVTLNGAYVGSFPLYDIAVQLPALGFEEVVRAVGVPSLPAGFDGIARFRFLNRFTYGNFGDPDHFGLES